MAITRNKKIIKGTNLIGKSKHTIKTGQSLIKLVGRLKRENSKIINKPQ